ncbi:MAG: hypothetical protein GX975_04420 [Clostridiales bacterium]|nr:hypothetical protein [Clostridiales bacterium]
MLKILVKKQMAEIFRFFFYNPKNSKGRTKAGTILSLVGYIFVMVVILGGMFTGYAKLLSPIATVGYGWFYYIMTGMVAIFIGAFGSIFNSYSGLYLAKDNELLLSMPIAPKDIVLSRLLSVYLMGLMYSAVCSVPAVIIFFTVVPASFTGITGSVLFIFLISVFVLVLSCLLGYVVARGSLKMKRKSFAAVLLALIGMTLYYFLYFKALDLIEDVVNNVVFYAEKLKGGAYLIYLFGRHAEGDPFAMFVIFALIMLLLVLTLLLLSRSFTKIATTSEASPKSKKRSFSAEEQRSPFAAMLRKEFGRFTSSADYMLNCGLGIPIMLGGGILLLLKRDFISNEFLPDLWKNLGGNFAGVATILCSAAICLIASMSDMAAPSVALEGKNLWIARSLPVSSRIALKAKLCLQIILTLPAVLFLSICTVIALQLSGIDAALVVLIPALFVVMNAHFALSIGLRSPDLDWTMEIYPIKQSLNVGIALFAPWLYVLALGGGYLYLRAKWGVEALPFAGTAIAVNILAIIVLRTWLIKKGTKIFEAL